MKPGDRLVCAFIEPQVVGTRFKDWFLHITVVPWFRLDLSSSELAQELETGYVGGQVFRALVKDEAHFGYKKRKTVNLVEATELHKLEGQTRRLLHAHKAWVVDEADGTRRGFRPHITHLKAGRPQAGELIRIDKLYIVEQKGDHKEVTGVVELGYGETTA